MLEGFQSVALVAELPPGKSKAVMVNNREIALFNIEGKYFAIHNLCPHEGGPLCEGRVKGFVVACRFCARKGSRHLRRGFLTPPVRQRQTHRPP